MRLTTRYEPDSLVCCSIETSVAVLVTVTVAPGTTAPAGSFTRPLTVARSICANAVAGTPNATRSAATCRKRFMVPPGNGDVKFDGNRIPEHRACQRTYSDVPPLNRS